MDVVVGLLVFAVPLWLVVKAVVVVPAAHLGVVRRLGKYTRQLSPGVHAVLPFIDTVRRVDARARELVLVAEPLVCADDKIVLVDATLEFMVTDGHLACTAVDDYEQALMELVLTRLREGAALVSAEELRSAPDQLSWEVRGSLGEDVKAWGLFSMWLRLAPTPQTESRPGGSRSFRLAAPA